LPKSVAVLALIAFAANASSSKADTVFTVNGTIANVNPYGGTDTLTGTVTIDTTAGTATVGRECRTLAGLIQLFRDVVTRLRFAHDDAARIGLGGTLGPGLGWAVC
jgi:hypothetical protein